jgi:hypothetical protein
VTVLIDSDILIEQHHLVSALPVKPLPRDVSAALC